MKIFEVIKKKWNNYLKNLAKENKKSFGDKRLDCCSMGKKSDK